MQERLSLAPVSSSFMSFKLQLQVTAARLQINSLNLDFSLSLMVTVCYLVTLEDRLLKHFTFH